MGSHQVLPKVLGIQRVIENSSCLTKTQFTDIKLKVIEEEPDIKHKWSKPSTPLVFCKSTDRALLQTLTAPLALPALSNTERDTSLLVQLLTPFNKQLPCWIWSPPETRRFIQQEAQAVTGSRERTVRGKKFQGPRIWSVREKKTQVATPCCPHRPRARCSQRRAHRTL